MKIKYQGLQQATPLKITYNTNKYDPINNKHGSYFSYSLTETKNNLNSKKDKEIKNPLIAISPSKDNKLNTLTKKTTTINNYGTFSNNRRQNNYENNINLKSNPNQIQDKNQKKHVSNPKYNIGLNRKKKNTTEEEKILEIINNESNQYKPNNNSKNGPYISGTSQSNTIISKNTINNKRTEKNDNNGNDSKITIISNKKNLINKRQINNNNNNNQRPNSANQKKKEKVQPYNSYTTEKKNNNNRPFISIPQNNNTRENLGFHSIVEIRNSPKKSYVLNVRKTDVITHKVKYKKRYNVSTEVNRPIINNENHVLFERRNVTKERKTVADLPDNVKVRHRYNYNYVPNITNIATISIDESGKKPKKEYNLSPRKTDIIKTERNNIPSYNVIEPKDRIKKYTLQGKKNDYKTNIYEKRINEITYDLKNNRNPNDKKIYSSR